MKWDSIIGQQQLKEQLKTSISQNRVSHAQLFVGREGFGTLALALAYAQEILAGENPGAASKVEHLNHLDLHLSFPTYTVNKSALSKNFLSQFREAVLENPYMSFDDWAAELESENKQLFLSVMEVEEWAQKFALKSFEGGSKILIVWNADKIRDDASNKLLKFLEEPPEKTLIILTAETDQDFLPTILSRVQLVKVPRIEDQDIAGHLETSFGLTREAAEIIAARAQGDLNDAVKLAQNDAQSAEFEALFVQWVREAFQVAKKPQFLKNIIFWARDIATWNREKQKNFLDFCSEMFRLALLQNYGADVLVYKSISVQKFNWDAFCGYVHGANIESILEEISAADYHLQRNANAKIVWTDLGIKLSRYIHRRPAS